MKRRDLLIALYIGLCAAVYGGKYFWTCARTQAIPYTLAGGALFDVSFKGGPSEAFSTTVVYKVSFEVPILMVKESAFDQGC